MKTNQLVVMEEVKKGFFTTVDTTTRQGQALVYNALKKSNAGLDEVIGVELVVKDVIFQAFAGEDKIDESTGEFVEQGRSGNIMIIVTSDNKTIATSSNVAIRSMAQILQIFGLPGSWGDDPIVVKAIKEQSTTSKFKYTDLIVVEKTA